MTKYPWAANKQKLARAIGIVGEEASEDEVRAEYLKIGGLVYSASQSVADVVPESVGGTESQTVTDPEDKLIAQESVADSSLEFPKDKLRKKKNAK